MEHREYKKIREAAEAAVLCIHGIVGTPNHFQMLLPLIPEEVSLWNLLLDGHGKGVRDFARTSMKVWQTQVQEAVDELAKTHKRIYIVAHSMGTLFAIEQAVRCQRIAGLFLLAVPIKLFLKPAMLRAPLKILFGKTDPDDKMTIAAQNCCGVKVEKNIFLYFSWIPRMVELLRKIRATRKLLPLVKTPCNIYQSAKDEVVSGGSVKYLRRYPQLKVAELERSGHYYYEEEDKAFLLEEFEKFMEAVSG